LFFKAAIVVFVPLMAAFVAIVIASTVTFVKRHSKFKRNFIVSLIVLEFITLPTVTTYTFKLYNCTDPFKEGTNYMADDVDVECWEGDHNFYAKNVGITSIVLWIVGLPAFAILVLFLKRGNL